MIVGVGDGEENPFLFPCTHTCPKLAALVRIVFSALGQSVRDQMGVVELQCLLSLQKPRP
eukprot:12908027-Prorocentrum_lima.AAC.1